MEQEYGSRKTNGEKAPVKSAAQDMNREVSEEDLEAVLAMLERFGRSEESRFKVVMSEELEKGTTEKQYHLGRCDVGSPWAKGQAFDVIQEEAGRGNHCG